MIRYLRRVSYSEKGWIVGQIHVDPFEMLENMQSLAKSLHIFKREPVLEQVFVQSVHILQEFFILKLKAYHTFFPHFIASARLMLASARILSDTYRSHLLSCF